MRSPSASVPRIPRLLCVAFAATLLALAARAGDPIPDVDVSMEQIPGGTVKVDSHSGGFDEIELKVGKGFAKALSPTSLPEGWALETDGKRVRVAGPAVAAGTPVRFKLDAGSAPRPEEISYWVRLEGRTLLERKKVPAKIVPPQEVIGSLQGVVTMPTQVAPGEPMQMRVEDEAELPPGGTWSLSGTVVAEEEDTEEAPPEGERRRVALVPAPGEEIPPAALDGIAGLLAVVAAGEGPWEITASPPTAAAAGESPVVRYQAKGPSGMVAIQQVTQQQLEIPPRGADEPAGEEERGNRAARDAEESSREGGVVLFSETEEGDDDGEGGDGGGNPFAGYCFEKLPSDTASGIEIIEAEDPELWQFCIEEIEDAKETPPSIRAKWTVGPDTGRGRTYEFVVDALSTTARSVMERPGGDGSTLDPVDPDEADRTDGGGTYFVGVSTSRTPLKKTVWGGTNPDGTVDLVVPADLAPGDYLAVRYLDAFGEVVVDVPEVPGVEVVEPSPGDEPRITDATPRAFAGRRVCVCGTFPGPDAWNGLLLDGEALGSPVSASSRMAWIQLPTGLAPGDHVVTGAPEPGFSEEDRASTLVLQVGGELDSSKLQRLETTPMRLWVEGAEEPLELRVRNLTPGIISIDGGEDQVIRTSGGSPNQLERRVHGLSPGAFNIQYELAGEACPCGGGSE